MFKTVFKEVRQYRTALFLTPVWTSAEVVMGVLIPYVTASLIDKGLNAGNLPAVYKYGGIMLLLAVLEKRVHLSIGACDVYVKVAGGIRIDEPAADLGLCVAMASSFANRLTRPKTIVFGEVGLSGEVRAVSQAESRVAEAKRLGFKSVVLPMKNFRQLSGEIKGIELFGAETVSEALKLAMPR